MKTVYLSETLQLLVKMGHEPFVRTVVEEYQKKETEAGYIYFVKE